MVDYEKPKERVRELFVMLLFISLKSEPSLPLITFISMLAMQSKQPLSIALALALIMSLTR